MRADARAKRDGFLSRLGSRPLIMGILNVTPDSFFDGGRFQGHESALGHAKQMIADGCDIVDVGAESTRPGATAVPEAEEFARLDPLLAELAQLETPVSIDTTKAAVAGRALALGAVMVNDVWGLQKDERMADTVAEAEAAVVIMHNRSEKDETLDIIRDIRRFFDRSLAIAARAGIPKQRIILDVGIGFGKTSRQNRDAVLRLSELKDYGLPLMVGASRKRFLGGLTGDGSEGTLAGTVAVSLAAIAAGAALVRVHDVAEHVAALRVFQALRDPR
ncbi:MAG TPA: dihydropteroate synthase [Pseudolabrys sp.]|nr:dihydropteroate synthase [Pseudolabrys sp.]